MLRAPEVTFPYFLVVILVFQQVCLSIGRLAYLAMAKVLFVGAKVCALAKAVIWKHAAAALYRANWKSRNFFGVVLQQVGIGRSRKWRVNFATMKKMVDLSARALTLWAEDFSDNENGAADDVGLSGLLQWWQIAMKTSLTYRSNVSHVFSMRQQVGIERKRSIWK